MLRHRDSVQRSVWNKFYSSEVWFMPGKGDYTTQNPLICFACLYTTIVAHGVNSACPTGKPNFSYASCYSNVFSSSKLLRVENLFIDCINGWVWSREVQLIWFSHHKYNYACASREVARKYDLPFLLVSWFISVSVLWKGFWGEPFQGPSAPPGMLLQEPQRNRSRLCMIDCRGMQLLLRT